MFVFDVCERVINLFIIRFYFTPVCLLYRYLHLCLKSTHFVFGSLFWTPSKSILWVPTCSKILLTNSQILINMWLKRNIFTFFFYSTSKCSRTTNPCFVLKNSFFCPSLQSLHRHSLETNRHYQFGIRKLDNNGLRSSRFLWSQNLEGRWTPSSWSLEVSWGPGRHRNTDIREQCRI